MVHIHMVGHFEIMLLLLYLCLCIEFTFTDHSTLHFTLHYNHIFILFLNVKHFLLFYFHYIINVIQEFVSKQEGWSHGIFNSKARKKKYLVSKSMLFIFLLLLPVQSTYTKMYLKKRFGIVGLQWRYRTKVWWKSLDIFYSRFWLRFYLQWWINGWAGKHNKRKDLMKFNGILVKTWT